MNIEELIKILDNKLEVNDTKKVNDIIYITCKISTSKANCPYCGCTSNLVHSKYIRTINDLPIQNNQVKLLVITRKFFCQNSQCTHKTFSENLSFVGSKAVKTNRLIEYIKNVALRDNSMDAVRTLKETGINVSSNTVLRIVKKKLIDVDYTAQNIGIDDFSSKKREIYNSIVINNDTHQKIEVINSREKDDVVKILKLFKKVKTVTRDFSQTYKNAINEALPKAKHIVDRFHILKNFTDDLGAYLKRTISDKVKLIRGNDKNAEEVLTTRQKNKIATANRKWEVVQEVKALYQAGNTKTYISKNLKISRETINKYLLLTEPPVKDSDCILDDYIHIIKELIIQGKKTKEIYQVMKDNGYKGKMTVLNMHMKSIKNEVKNNTTYLKRSKIKKLLFCNLEDLKSDKIKEDIKFYLSQNEELQKVLNIEKEFKAILFSGKTRQLRCWIKSARKLNIPEINSFANLIESDFEAVKNAIIYNYSNGVTEGFNNKTKVIKRQMYGRCGFELLRLKILA